MATFNEIRRRSKLLADRVSNLTGVDEKLVMNVIMYAKELTTPERPDLIDKIVFITQMSTRFGMYSKFLIELIYESLKIKGTRYVKLEEYVRMVCTFYSDDLTLKVDFTFKVYDLQRDGHLDTKEIHTLLMSSIIFASDDADTDDQVKELIDMVMNMTDENNDGIITLQEYRDHVRNDSLFIQLLGPVLPLDSVVHAFFGLLRNRPPHVISEYFCTERFDCLNEPAVPGKADTLYPIRLEMP